ncbi:MAG: hypothetical protein RL376_1493 [Verrucomicrobiota bacterium]|jgi:hypothetical protein
MATFLAVTGWLTAAFLTLGCYSLRHAATGWRRRYEETRDSLATLERKHLVADMDKSEREWLRDEVERLSKKCEVICTTVRRMKGRGKLTCQMNPTHRF